MDMRDILQQTIQRYGTSVLEEPARFASILNDLRMGEGKREANLLLAALREGIPDRLVSAGQGAPITPLIGQLARRLVDDVGLADETALWAVESWALALGLRFDKQVVAAPVVAPKPVAPAPPPAADPRSQLLASISWCEVPAGPFLYGETNERRTLPRFRIMKTPVTVATYRAYCLAAGAAMGSAPSWGWRDDHPMVNVSWNDAQDFCEWSGLALPTEEQWEKAARGTDGREYPWGNNWDARRCVCNAESTAPVGSKPSCASPYGCLDMAGNAWEWCADWYDSTRTCRVLRGGAWLYVNSVFFRARYRDGGGPVNRDFNQGFRCVSPEVISEADPSIG
ncbi:MAG: SUMF1/EgtB/PvdO family nonheme iron enzyme [Armatimonadetes bacterium]|nr:SUMF1/EgtB/PvdO family nonheme iron enzyme [Armatimonadota bacterium]